MQVDKDNIILSIIVCTHNRATLLKETLSSIFGQQTNFAMEVIVSDDCSTDNTVAMLNLLKKDYPFLRINVTLENYGAAGNWASAMKLVSGKFVAFLDDDDLWTDVNRMQILVDYLNTHPSVDVVYTDGYLFKEHSKKKYPMRWPREDFPNLQKMWQGSQPCISLDMMVVRTSLIKKSINYDDYIRFRFPAQDWITNVLLLFHSAQFAFIDQPSVAVRQSAGSLSRTINYKEIEYKAQQEAIMNCYVDQQITGNPTISYGVDKQRLFQSLLNAAYKNGDWRTAKEYSKKLWKHSLRISCSKTWITFNLYRLAKRWKAK